MIRVDFIVVLEFNSCSPLVLKLAFLLKKLKIKHRSSNLIDTRVIFVSRFEILAFIVLQAEHFHGSIALYEGTEF